jgi:hypothetical protein
MAATNERVMDMVRREIDKNPDVKSQDLFEKAKRIDSGINNLSIRQFHATYPLQVKRSRKAGRRRPGRPPKAAAKVPARRGRPPKTAAAPRKRGRPPGRPPGAGRGAPSAPARATPSAPSGSGRDAVRKILLQFATALAAAEERAQMIQVIGGVESYVDQVMQAANR